MPGEPDLSSFSDDEMPEDAVTTAGSETDEETEGQARAPWHFKVIVVGTVVYLGYRLYQGIGWLAHHIH